MHGETRSNTTLVVGTVVRIFKDRTGVLKRGQKISFDQPFISRFDPNAGPKRETCARAGCGGLPLRLRGSRLVGDTCDQFTLLRQTTFLGPVNPADTDRGGSPKAPAFRNRRLN